MAAITSDASLDPGSWSCPWGGLRCLDGLRGLDPSATTVVAATCRQARSTGARNRGETATRRCAGRHHHGATTVAGAERLKSTTTIRRVNGTARRLQRDSTRRLFPIGGRRRRHVNGLADGHVARAVRCALPGPFPRQPTVPQSAQWRPLASPPRSFGLRNASDRNAGLTPA